MKKKSVDVNFKHVGPDLWKKRSIKSVLNEQHLRFVFGG